MRAASVCGLIYMLTLLFASNYPGAGAAPWQYFGAALNHLVLALRFGAFGLGRSADALSLRSYLQQTKWRWGPASFGG